MHKGLEQDFSTPEAEVEAKPEVWSLDGLAAWLAKQPADGTYDWYSKTDCAACRYLKASGFETGKIGDGVTHANYKRFVRTLDPDHQKLFLGMFFEQPWTFGAASSRLAALQGKG